MRPLNNPRRERHKNTYFFLLHKFGVLYIFAMFCCVFVPKSAVQIFIFGFEHTHTDSQGRLLVAFPSHFHKLHVSQLSQENAPRQFPTIYFLDQGKPMALFKTADSEKYLDTSCVAQPMKSLFPEEMQVKCKFQVFSGSLVPASSIS